jgi:hypothetical protein
VCGHVSKCRGLPAVLAVSLLSACGSSGSDDATSSKPSATSAPASSQGVVAKCHQAFDPFIAALRQVDESRKDASGLAAYQEAMRKLTSLYDHFNLKTIPSTSCHKAVGDPAAEAYKVHLSAVQAPPSPPPDEAYIRKIPLLTSSSGALAQAARQWAMTARVSRGSMMPSSQSRAVE